MNKLKFLITLTILGVLIPVFGYQTFLIDRNIGEFILLLSIPVTMVIVLIRYVTNHFKTNDRLTQSTYHPEPFVRPNDWT